MGSSRPQIHRPRVHITSSILAFLWTIGVGVVIGWGSAILLYAYATGYFQ